MTTKQSKLTFSFGASDDEVIYGICNAYLDTVRQGLTSINDCGELLTRKELSKFLGVSPDVVTREFIDDEQFPRIRVGNMVRFPKSLVMKYIADHSEV